MAINKHNININIYIYIWRCMHMYLYTMFHRKRFPCAPKDGLVRTRLANPCANPRFFPCAEPLCGTFALRPFAERLCAALLRSLCAQSLCGALVWSPCAEPLCGAFLRSSSADSYLTNGRSPAVTQALARTLFVCLLFVPLCPCGVHVYQSLRILLLIS